MNTPSETAFRIVSQMGPEEREALGVLFGEYIPPDDPHWLLDPSWSVPATEIALALELIGLRDY